LLRCSEFSQNNDTIITLKSATARKEVTIVKPCFALETACIIYLHGNEEGLYSDMNLTLASILYQWKGQHPYRIKEQHLVNKSV